MKQSMLALVVLPLLVYRPAYAEVPSDEAERAKLIGQPKSIQVQPQRLSLMGPRAFRQLVITGRYADGSERDLTPFAALSDVNKLLDLHIGGYVQGRHNGKGTLVVNVGSVKCDVPVEVNSTEKPEPVSFRREVIAAFNVGGCNMGSCHGSPSGKNGFRLSLRGYDPTADYDQLTRDVLGRRTDRLLPEASLIWQKGLGRIPHEGGQRFPTSSIPAQILHAWLRDGLRNDSESLSPLQSVEVIPGPRILGQPGRWQQLAVIAKFRDGSERDVTRLTVFSSSDPGVADVNTAGLVEFRQGGDVAILCRYLQELVSVRLSYLEPKPGFQWKQPREQNYIDTLVFAKLRQLNIQPSELCTDAEFLRRIYLDVCGILPTTAEVTAFLADGDPRKRERVIDQLLQRPEYADFWTLKWADVLRNQRKAVQIKGVHVFQHWLREQIARNRPFDQVVHDLLTASGQTFDNPPANYYRITRDPTSLAETTAQLFFGVRMQCAKCHNHPFERWTQDDYYSMAAFFARVRQKKDPTTNQKDPMAVNQAEVVYSERSGEITQPRTGQVVPPRFLGGTKADVPPGKDRREVFADWLTGRDNPFFAKSVANRIWFHLLGRGIVDPVDDFRDSNPSANDALLDRLAQEFRSSGFDAKKLIRDILTSRTYQLSAQANPFNKDDNKYFSHAITKLLTAEQLLDALCSATEMPEKYAGFPVGTRAVQLPDGDVQHVFLKTFGQPARELACECEREGDSNLSQALQLINGETIHQKVVHADNRLGRFLKEKRSERALVGELYLATLSRPATEDEMRLALAYVAKATDKRKAWEDVHWALLNHKEFLFRH